MIRRLVLLFFIGGFAFGSEGDHGGNGGDLAVCVRPDGTVSYELLDYFEAAHQSPAMPFELGDPSWDASEKVQYALSRLSDLDPVRGARYEAEAKYFLSLVDWITQGPGLEHIPDLGEVAIPTHCQVKQIAIRRKTFHPSIKPYLIDERLWLKLDEDHKAGLILHELIYAQMRDLGQRDSINARKYNGILSSPAFESMAAYDYEALVKDLFVEIQPLAFGANKFDVNVMQKQFFHLGLRGLLQYPVKGKLSWQFLESLPSWMRFDSVSETISGLAANGAKDPILLSLIVRDENSAAIAQLRIHVK